MPAITKNGRRLADKLNPAIGTTRKIQETCSLIARHASTLQWLNEYQANGGNDRLPDETRQRLLDETYERSEKLERRISELAESLPHYDTDDDGRGPFAAYFQGDPRGCAVKLTGPRSMYDDWGQEGICVETD